MAPQFAVSHATPRRCVRGFARRAVLLAAVLVSAAAAAAPTDLARVGGQAIEVRRVPADAGQPPAGTIVIENGLRADLDGWQAVIAGLAPATQQGWALLAYNRPGIGRSEATERPRDGHQVVADLRELLRQQGLRPPYLLVGHSLGGLYQQLFAREYPQEVAGLVLVDAVYPGVIKKPEEFPFYTRWAKGLFMGRMAARETDAIHATGEQVLALPWPARTPWSASSMCPSRPAPWRWTSASSTTTRPPSPTCAPCTPAPAPPCSTPTTRSSRPSPKRS